MTPERPGCYRRGKTGGEDDADQIDVGGDELPGAVPAVHPREQRSPGQDLHAHAVAAGIVLHGDEVAHGGHFVEVQAALHPCEARAVFGDDLKALAVNRRDPRAGQIAVGKVGNIVVFDIHE